MVSQIFTMTDKKSLSLKKKNQLYFKWPGANRQELTVANESIVDAKHLVCVAGIYQPF